VLERRRGLRKIFDVETDGGQGMCKFVSLGVAVNSGAVGDGEPYVLVWLLRLTLSQISARKSKGAWSIGDGKVDGTTIMCSKSRERESK